MSRFFAFFGRFALILIGFACASLAASAFLHLLVGARIGIFEDEIWDSARVSMVFSVIAISALISYYAFLPAFVFFLAAEILGWRSWPVHALGGGAAAAGALFLQSGALEGSVSGAGLLEMVFVACGVVGGIAYWAVAGRSAGWLWQDDEHAAPGPDINQPPT